MRIRSLSRPVLLLLPWILLALPAAGQVLPAPPELAAALLVKLAAFEKRVAASGDVTVFVLGDSRAAAEFQKCVGAPVGPSRLAAVTAGAALPSESPSILFVGDRADVKAAVAYTQSRKILSATADPARVVDGVSLGVGVGADGRPRIVLNLSSSSEEDLDWNPAILKLARTVR
jgi:hypothetical protein